MYNIEFTEKYKGSKTVLRKHISLAAHVKLQKFCDTSGPNVNILFD